MFERFRWGLTSGERYSTGRLTPQKRGILCACQHFVSERVGVLAEYGVVVRLPLGLRSLTLLRCLSRHSSLVLCSCLTLQAMAPKAYLTGKSKDKVAAKKTRKKPGGPRLRRCWAELHGWSFTRSCFWGWTLAQNQASLDWAPLLTSKRRRACSSFDDRHNVSSKERSAGTQAVACQALWVIYDRCHTWIRSSAMAGKARRPLADKGTLPTG